jgi:hypothetical protein
VSTGLSDSLSSRPDDEGFGSLLFGFACHVLAFALGIVWAFATVILLLATDGVPPEDYEAYNRAAFGMLLSVLIPNLAIGTWITYVLAHLVVPRRLLALLLAQLPPVVLATALFAWW